MKEIPLRILLVYPEFPDTFWCFKHALRFVQKKTGALRVARSAGSKHGRFLRKDSEGDIKCRNSGI